MIAIILDNTHEDLITISSHIVQISNERMELRLSTDHVGGNNILINLYSNSLNCSFQ